MAPKTKEQFEQIRQKSMRTIMQAALELFAHNGFHNTSISQIASKAGVSKGLLYNYFDSKKALLDAILAGALHQGQELIDGSLELSDNPASQLERIVRSSFKAVKENLEYWKLLLSLSLQSDVFEEIKIFLTDSSILSF